MKDEHYRTGERSSLLTDGPTPVYKRWCPGYLHTCCAIARTKKVSTRMTASSAVDEAMVPELPSLTPTRIYISRQSILASTIDRLGLVLHERGVSRLGDSVLACLRLDVPAHGDFPKLHQRLFYGDCCRTSEEAYESASAVVLAYFTKAGIILVDDVNLSELLVCRRKLLASSFWTSAFEGQKSNPGPTAPAAGESNGLQILEEAAAFVEGDRMATPPDKEKRHATQVLKETPSVGNAQVLQCSSGAGYLGVRRALFCSDKNSSAASINQETLET